jgi:histidine ammonia-lyase
VTLEILDRYLLGEAIPKERLVKSLLAEPSPQALAAPFYRALAAVGVRAADEAFIALRLAVRGEAPTDEAVRELRELLARTRDADEKEKQAVRAAYHARVDGTLS